MKRRILVDYEDASPQVKVIYDEIKQTFQLDDVPNLWKVFGGNEIVLRGNWEKSKHTFFNGTLPLPLKNLILFVISVQGENKYCTHAHGFTALQFDKSLTYDGLMSIASGEDYGELPASYKAALEVASKVSSMSHREVATESFDFEKQLRDEDFSEAEIDEVLAQVDFAIMKNVITKIYEIPIDFPFGPNLS